jgi:class 3 adenylate cyclase
VKRTGDGILIEYRSVVDAVRCAIEVQNGMMDHNATSPPQRRIDLRIGFISATSVEESAGDLMRDGVNIPPKIVQYGGSIRDGAGVRRTCQPRHVAHDSFSQLPSRVF